MNGFAPFFAVLDRIERIWSVFSALFGGNHPLLKNGFGRFNWVDMLRFSQANKTAGGLKVKNFANIFDFHPLLFWKFVSLHPKLRCVKYAYIERKQFEL